MSSYTGNRRTEYLWEQLKLTKNYTIRLKVAWKALTLGDMAVIYVHRRGVSAVISVAGNKVERPLMMAASVRKVADSLVRFIRGEIPKKIMDRALLQLEDADNLKELSDKIYKGEV